MGLKDKHHSPYEPEIVQEAKAWVVSIACTKPKDHGLAAELWTISALARFVGESATDAGFPRPMGIMQSISSEIDAILRAEIELAQKDDPALIVRW